MMIDESQELKKRFAGVLNKVQQIIPFNPAWKDAVSYGNAVTLVNLEPGKVAQSEDPETNQGLILVGTVLGTVVVYESAPGNVNQKFALRYNAPKALDFMLGGSTLNIGRFSMIVTDFDPSENIGVHLGALHEALREQVEPAVSVTVSHGPAAGNTFNQPAALNTRDPKF